ncbi:hypothetical protein ILUMI_17920 [Ignelater luminosus]|uniref:NEDD8-activating enzyme E1 regulatory subunit n=1 Tax=Ignelater luminosus TaxID=2038154 RepID=A0A8K0G7F8_IGNLU|nr:hypothetical protein ILUMI_17920 [Ignelater luminosus]
MASPSPKSPEQSDKSKKYDRQLRLWGDHGQKLLEKSKICLINATALGTEILKSLVLPGIGAFTIVDGEKVTEEDIGSNFFLEETSIGMPRAQAATQGLLELNPDVRGDYIDESPEHVMAHTQDFFNNFTVVIATALPEKVLMPLSRQLWATGVPLVVCRSIGFLGYVRLQIKEHCVVEAHPDNEAPDLRLDKPWPALRTHLDKVDVSSLGTKERSHVPALTILYYYMQKYKEMHGGSLPKTRSEKDELRKMIRTSLPPDGDTSGALEENYEQAVRFVNVCINSIGVSAQIQAILDDERCTNLTSESSSFWIICAALRELVQSEGSLPVRGSLPDMAADTTSYVTLQQLYQRQAQLQAEAVYRRAVQIARSLGQSPDIISEAEVKLFCKHSSELYVLRGNCIADEYQNSSPNIAPYLEDPESLMFYYVILRGLERFISEYNTYPGQFDDQVEPDVLKLKTLIGKLLSEWGCPTPVTSDDRVHEVCRYGGAELHSVSAMLGGCTAHEVIKLITHQYKPINNTFIYDAITSTSATFFL